ncbi:MAG: Tim44 domain-containing protein [Variovorax sp.]|jgi:predicted lipid-binding transport protein (Tim44 family)|nr:MAG: Tim44 domain-containing protein [Variovorax sp.]
MKNFWSVMLVCALVLVSADADARRMGGGKSVGRQSNNVTQREAAPPAAPATPGAPAQSANNAAARPATAAPAAAAPKRNWGGMLGGLAAGLGLAWLASSLGLGAGFGNILLIALLAMAALFAWRMFAARRAAASSNGTGRGNDGGFAFQGAGAGAPADVPVAAQYRADKVGNDASARPWESSGTSYDSTATAERGGSSMAGAAGAGTGSMIGSALVGAQTWGVPAGFDSDGFLAAAKRNFVTLQGAWDRSDIGMLRSMMTDSMVGEIQSQLSERESHTGGQPNKTEVVVLDAKLLGIEELPDAYMASVEFSGMIKEDAASGPSPFREVWNMTKPTSGSGGWLVAGVQALQ